MIFELPSKDGNITPEKARKSRQMQLRDKTMYVRVFAIDEILCYRGNGLKSIRGSWGGHLGSISGVLDLFRGLYRAQKPKTRPIQGKILTFPDPPANLVKFFWSKMACTGVPQIVLHISYSTPAYWGHFRPCKVSFFFKCFV